MPIVVAKCGVFLKEKGNSTLEPKRSECLTDPTCLAIATDVEGIFRLSGSAKRIKELQAIFDSPDRYGKGLDWTGYTVHDAANILRRYLNQLPQPIVPLDFYELCREPLRSHQAQAVGDMEAQAQDTGDFDQNAAIAAYQQLIIELPPLNRQLLLYILDLLAVFASKSDLNRMNSANLAAIFQPGLLSHPAHDMKPQEYRLSQDVLIFLIEHQDSFLIGMSGTAVDEKTAREVQSGEPPPRESQPPSVPGKPQSAIGRSDSNASAGAESIRRFGGIRRNLSVSSKHSRSSANVPIPVSPTPGSTPNNSTGVGVQRSNTLPSRRSPGISSSRFNRPADSPISTAPMLSPSGHILPNPRAASPGSKLAQETAEGRSASTASSMTPTAETYFSLAPAESSLLTDRSNERLLPTDKFSLPPPPPPPGFGNSSPLVTPTRERKLSSLFVKSPSSDSERREVRQPNKLRKKRLPDSSNPSAQSSTQSLQGGTESPANQTFYTPLPTPGGTGHIRSDPLASMAPVFSNTSAIPVSEAPPHGGYGNEEVNSPPLGDQYPPHSGPSQKLSKSPALSVRSRASITDASEPPSEVEHTDDSAMKDAREKKKRHSWLSSSARKNGESRTTLSTTSQLGSNPIAENSTTSIGSSDRPGKSITQDLQQSSTEHSGCLHNQSSSNDSTPSKDKESVKDKESSHESPEKKGPIGWLKAKVSHAKEERKEREAEKDRAKTPSQNDNEQPGSQQSVFAATQEGTQRGRSAGSDTGMAKA